MFPEIVIRNIVVVFIALSIVLLVDVPIGLLIFFNIENKVLAVVMFSIIATLTKHALMQFGTKSGGMK